MFNRTTWSHMNVNSLSYWSRKIRLYWLVHLSTPLFSLLFVQRGRGAAAERQRSPSAAEWLAELLNYYVMSNPDGELVLCSRL